MWPRTDNFLNDIFIGRKNFYALEGAKISFRFLDLRNDEMIDFGGKSSLSFGDESKKCKM